MKRNIILIDESRCDGCGLCATACAEGALQIINGKARLVSETYCDGLGACLGTCPRDAIRIEERDVAAFDEQAVAQHLGHTAPAPTAPPPPAAPRHAGCPGLAVHDFGARPATAPAGVAGAAAASELRQWPVQLHLVPAQAPLWQGASLLLAADCVPFALPDFHARLLAGHRLAIACPKLDNREANLEKLTAILRQNDIHDILVARMEVPCCSGLTRLAEQAMAAAGKTIPLHEVIITLRGELPKPL